MIDFNEFLEKYKLHLNWLNVDPPAGLTYEKIFKIFAFVIKNGGWVRTTGLDQWKNYTDLPSPRLTFESCHLVSFERVLTGSWTLSAEETLGLDYSLLQPMSVKTKVRPDEWEELLAEDIVLYRNVYKFGLREDLISLDSIKRNHGETQINVLVQESDTSEFSVRKVAKQTMRLEDYIKLMETTDKTDEFIKFAVNVDIGDWQAEVDEIRSCLPSIILWCSEDDSLKHLRQHILGMTLPQLYLKINGCWTGGHEENLRFPSANINHGPSSCEWWALDSTQSLQLRECIQQEKNFEIYNSETLWWPDEIYCIARGFRIFHTVQLPGDLVIVGPGTIHWVKSLGVTTNSAWNFGPKLLPNFIKSYEREYINQAIKYRSLVPMNILALDLLNEELATLDIGLVEYLRSGIENKAKDEQEVLETSGIKEIEINNNDNVIHCEACYRELFRVYYKCKRCEENRKKGGMKKCFFCLDCVRNSHRRCRGKVCAVKKFEMEELQMLIQQIELRSKGLECKGNFEGLKYPFDKNEEEGVYVSRFNGIKFENKDEQENLGVATFVDVKLPAPAKKLQKVSDLLKKKKKNDEKNGDGKKGRNREKGNEDKKLDLEFKDSSRVKLRSIEAKKRVMDVAKCRNISDLHKFLKDMVEKRDVEKKRKVDNESKKNEEMRDSANDSQLFNLKVEEGQKYMSEKIENQKNYDSINNGEHEEIEIRNKMNSVKQDLEENLNVKLEKLEENVDRIKIEEVNEAIYEYHLNIRQDSEPTSSFEKYKEKPSFIKNDQIEPTATPDRSTWNYRNQNFFSDLPLKRKRSSAIYSPVADLIPIKSSKGN